MQFACWQVGTVLGLLLGAAVPDPAAFGLDAAFPAALMAMLVSLLRASDARRVAAGAAAVSLAATPFLPAGIPVLAALLGVGAAGKPARSPGPGTDETGGTEPRGDESREPPVTGDQRIDDRSAHDRSSEDRSAHDRGSEDRSTGDRGSAA